MPPHKTYGLLSAGSETRAERVRRASETRAERVRWASEARAERGPLPFDLDPAILEP